MKIYEVTTTLNKKYTIYSDSEETIKSSKKFNLNTGKIQDIKEITDSEINLMIKDNELSLRYDLLSYLKRPEVRLSEVFIECKKKLNFTK